MYMSMCSLQISRLPNLLFLAFSPAIYYTVLTYFGAPFVCRDFFKSNRSGGALSISTKFKTSSKGEKVYIIIKF